MEEKGKIVAEVNHLQAEASLFEEQTRQLRAPLWAKSTFWTISVTLVVALLGLGQTIKSKAAEQLAELKHEQFIQQQKLVEELLVEFNRTTPQLRGIFREELLKPATCKYVETKIKNGNCEIFQKKYLAAYGYVVGRTLKQREKEVAEIVRLLKVKAFAGDENDTSSK